MTDERKTLSRRDAVRLLTALPAAAFVACETTARGVFADAAAADVAVAEGWATGGTAAMTGMSSYPDPFAGGSTTCELLCDMTIGPCHTTSPERSDVSNGWEGIPVLLALKVVDESCEPIEDAIVEIWHTNHRGGYSGDIAAMCNLEAADMQEDFFRGYQRTDADGRVSFQTCYPGWYSSRAVHIHFRVQTGTYDASDSAAAEVISQLFFPDSLNDEIFTSVDGYSEYGTPDTTLSTDTVVGGADDVSPYVCSTERMADGAMLASAMIILRSTSASSCTLDGSGGGGPGGRP